MKVSKLFCLPLASFCLITIGCTSVNTFGTAARSGDTVTVGLGWQQELTRQNIQVSITDSSGAMFMYLPGDPAIRTVFNSCPDPLSRLIVGAETGQDTLEGSLAGTATLLINASVTAGDKDYMQTFMMIDLPVGMATGPATITVADSAGNPIPGSAVFNSQIDPFNVEVLAGVGSPSSFSTQENINVDGYLHTMERSAHFTLTLQGPTVPYGVQLDLSHDPDVDNGGSGRAYVVNPRGDLKSVNWTDDGTNLRVILLPARNQTMSDMKQFKFYVAGGIINLQPVLPVAVTAYDINGNPVPGVTVTIN